MNSDPYDSAAWRSFGMLDADESAIFDEAMRHDPLLRSASQEMDRLSAAVALAIAPPVTPRPGQLERLHSRLGLNPSRRAYLWLGISGWAAAAVFALLLVFSTRRQPPVASAQAPADAAVANVASKTPVAEKPTAAPSPLARPGATSPGTVSPPSSPPTETDAQKVVRVETRRLTQEIEVLRDNLEKFQQRDRILFQAVPGIALPVIMKMTPPGLEPEIDPTIAANDSQSPVPHLLADALRTHEFAGQDASNGFGQASGSETPALPDALPGEVAGAPVAPAANASPPSAIPIYDAARDTGTLVVNNLPPAPTGKVYNLWVTTSHSETPVFVGSLPEITGARSESFDFSLGSNMVLPSGFALTEDAVEKPVRPSEANTVLQGPPTPPR